MDTINDLENQQLNERRLATIEASINKTLLYDGEKNLSYKCSSSFLICIFAGLVIIIILLMLIIVLHLLTF